jgi:hypothetical protein
MRTIECPSENDFFEAFGIRPIETDPDMACEFYVKQSNDGLQEIEISFSLVALSFQVVQRCGGKETMVISSEKLRHIELYKDDSGSGIRAVFEIDNVKSEVVVILQPDLYVHWWTLAS